MGRDGKRPRSWFCVAIPDTGVICMEKIMISSDEGGLARLGADSLDEMWF